ncbi:MAG: aminotransferase class III-fold pyridoxal phosphate-dependent enzyme [Chloroflexota bacterium]|nr:aminotransferase class III-fold pyridoxal phosphate-dependent enzyme [Chloroflexota bacterium]
MTSTIRAGARPHPLYFERGEGPYLWDVDGRRYVDFVLGYGPLILGHAPRVVREAVSVQLGRGLTFGSQHRLEPELAELLVDVVPGAEQAIFATTGSEAVAAALRLARTVSGRRLVLKFEGHYHGWLDGVFASVGYDPSVSGSSERPATVPSTLGIPAGALSDMVVAQWNDPVSVEAVLSEHRGQVAAILCEPIAVNGGLIAPVAGFLETLHRLAAADGALLVFDEVITGFRVALGGAQERFAVNADLAIFAKAIAGGVALSAVTGSRAVMAPIADGRLAHNGTFNGNPIAMAAGVASLRHLADGRATIYPELDRLATRLARGLGAASPRLTVRQAGPIVHTAVDEPSDVRTVRDRAQGDPFAHGRFIEALLARGIHATPRGLWYVSTAHGDADIDATAAAALDAAAEVLS